MIKSIIFDLGGVVVSDKIRDYVHRTAAKYYGASVEKIIVAVNKHEKDFNIPNWDEDRYWNAIAKDLGISNPPHPRHIWTENYLESTPPVEEVIELIKKLRINGYKLAALSNTIQEHVNLNRERGLLDLFDVEVFSCDHEINSKKPDIKIYKICLKKVELPPEQCLFIDDKEEYLSPARELGMYTILYQSPVQLKDDLKKLDVIF